MRRSILLLISLIVVVPLVGCRDGMPTDASLRPPTASRRVLVSGPITPVDAGTVTSPVITIANMQSDLFVAPRVRGDLACYTDYAAFVVRFYRFSTNISTPVETTPVRDFECGVDGNHVAFVSTGSTPFAWVFDASTSVITQIGPQLYPGPRNTAIGGNTVSFIEFASDFLTSKVRVSDLTSPAASTVLSDAGLSEASPNVSPNGNVVVWERSERPLGVLTYSVMKAVRDPGTGTWSQPQVVTTYAGFENPQPDADDSYIVWRGASGVGGEKDIFVQAVSGGSIMQVAIPGSYESDPRVNGGVIAFYGITSTGTSRQVMSYNIATNTLYHVSSVAEFVVNSRSVDVSALSNGYARVIWEAHDVGTNVGNVYATTFSLAATPPPPVFSFGGFQQPFRDGAVTANAHAVVNVKFSLGGDFGVVNIFAPGSPTSANADCATGATLGAASPTVAQSMLTYNGTTDTYMYKWNPDVLWARTCRKLTLTFVDGTTASALVTFR